MDQSSPEIGQVIHYKFLFSDEVKAGLQEARAHHPCVIMGKKELKDGSVMVRVMPISHTPPDKTTPAIELNHAIKNHLGLDKQRQWIKTHELNRFTWPGEERDKISVPMGPKVNSDAVLLFGFACSRVVSKSGPAQTRFPQERYTKIQLWL